MHFDIALQEDGSALITETREIVFSGDREFTRYGVNNIFTGPRVFSDWQVSIDGTSASQLDEPDNDILNVLMNMKTATIGMIVIPGKAS